MKKVIYFFSLFIFLLTTSPILASTYTAFGIFPPKISIISPPKQVITIPLKIVNAGDLEILTFSAQSITVDPEGSVELSNSQEEAVSWLKIGDKDISKSIIKVDAASESSFSLKVDIPDSALVNDHYLALIVSPKNDDAYNATFTRAVAQIAIPIIISVKENPIPESLDVASFEIPKFSLSSKIPVFLKLKNNGKYLVETVGTVTASSPLSKKHQEILPKVAVLSNSERIVWPKNFTFDTKSLGPTTITINIQLDQSNSLKLSKTVFIFPASALLIISVAFFAIVLLIISRKVK